MLRAILFLSVFLMWQTIYAQDIMAFYTSDWDSGVDSTKTYFGVFQYSYGESIVRKIQISDSLEDDPAKGMLPVLICDGNPEFIVEGISYKDSIVTGIHLHDEMLFPGEVIGYNLNNNNYFLYAEGNVIKSRSGEFPFEKISNYKIILKETYYSGDDTITAIHQLYESELIPFGDGQSYLNNATIRWIGDLNQDGKLDIIMTESDHFACHEVILLMMDKHSHKLKKAFRYSYCDC